VDQTEFQKFARTRDIDVRNSLAVRHLPLVKYIAAKMAASLPRHIEIDDLISWGYFGLLDAIEKYDCARGVMFSTYAVPRIRGAILDGLQKMEWAPKQIMLKVRRTQLVANELAAELCREPTVDEIAGRMDESPADVREWRLDAQRLRVGTTDAVQSEDSDIPQSQPSTPAEQDVAAQKVELTLKVAEILAKLTASDRSIFRLYYGLGLTLREIAEQQGVSVSLATQAHTRLVEFVRLELAIS
jgi:RNA polymerase sigma factor for flagellar operon FliA